MGRSSLCCILIQCAMCIPTQKSKIISRFFRLVFFLSFVSVLNREGSRTSG